MRWTNNLSKLRTEYNNDQIEAHKERRRFEAICRLSKIEKNEVILDVGCGKGFLTDYFASKSIETIGVDISLSKLKMGRKEVENRRGAKFVCGSVVHIPFRNSLFDVIISSELLEHVSDIRNTVREFSRILRDDGRIIISVPYDQKIVYYECIHCKKMTPVAGHVHSFDEKKIRSLLEEQGIDVLKFEKIVTGINNVQIFSTILRKLPFALWTLLDNMLIKTILKPNWIIVIGKKRKEGK